MHDRLRHGLQGAFEREAPRERVRDLVQCAEPPRSLAFGLEYGAERLAELLRLFVQPRVLHGDRELRRERREQRAFSCSRSPCARVGDEQPDRLVVHAQRNCERRRYARGGEGMCGRLEREVAAAGLHKDRLPRPQCAGRQAEQRVRDALVACVELTARRSVQPVPLVAQVDADAIDGEQRGDAVDSRVERMRQREVRDRFADDREQCTCPLELELDVAGSRAEAEGVRHARGELDKRLELDLSRFLGIAQLHHAGNGLAEANRDRRPGVEGIAVDEERLPGRPRLEGERPRPLGRAFFPAAFPRERLQGVVGQLPDGALLRARCERRLAQGLSCGTLGLRSRRERLAAPAEQGECALIARGAPRVFEGERQVSRHELGECPARCVQLADQLERAEQLFAGACWNEHAARRRLVVRGHARARDLGGKRRMGRGDRPGDQRPLVLVEHTHDGELGACRVDGRLRDQLEHLTERRRGRKPLRQTGEALERQPLGSDHHLQAKYGLTPT